MKRVQLKLDKLSCSISSYKEWLWTEQEKVCAQVQRKLSTCPSAEDGPRVSLVMFPSQNHESDFQQIRLVVTGDNRDPITEVDTWALDFCEIRSAEAGSYLQQYMDTSTVEFVLRQHARLELLRACWRWACRVDRYVEAMMSADYDFETSAAEVRGALDEKLEKRDPDGHWPEPRDYTTAQ